MRKLIVIVVSTLLCFAGAHATSPEQTSNFSSTGTSSGLSTPSNNYSPVGNTKIVLPQNDYTKAPVIKPKASEETQSDSALSRFNDADQQLAQYEKRIEELESEFGLYGEGISQQLMSLGLLYQQNNQHIEAIDTLKRSLHLSKVNLGLYNAEQFKILNSLITSYRAQQKWANVNNSYEYMMWLALQSYGKFHPETLNVVAAVTQWHFHAYRMRQGQSYIDHLIVAHGLLTYAVEIVENLRSEHSLALIPPLQGIVLANYLFATHSNDSWKKKKEEKQPMSGGQHVGQLGRLDEGEKFIDRSYRNGRRALERIVSIYAQHDNTSSYQLANAKLDLGDWLLLFNKRHSAFANYKAAYQVVKESGLAGQEEFVSLFEKPVALPKAGFLKRNIEMTTQIADVEQNKQYIIASLDITALGRSKNIEVIEDNFEESSKMSNRVVRSLRKTVFRPKLVDGVPTRTMAQKVGFVLAEE